jgi:hypothetical protein
VLERPTIYRFLTMSRFGATAGSHLGVVDRTCRLGDTNENVVREVDRGWGKERFVDEWGTAEAKSAATEALRLDPKLTVKWLSENIWNSPLTSTACARRDCQSSNTSFRLETHYAPNVARFRKSSISFFIR